MGVAAFDEERAQGPMCLGHAVPAIMVCDKRLAPPCGLNFVRMRPRPLGQAEDAPWASPAVHAPQEPACKRGFADCARATKAEDDAGGRPPLEHPSQEFHNVFKDFLVRPAEYELEVPQNERDPLEPMPASFGMRNSATPGR